MPLRRSPTFWWIFGTYCLLVIGSVAALALIANRAIEAFELQQTEQELHTKAFLVVECVRHSRPEQLAQLQLDAETLDSRVTLLDSRGKVLTDTAMDPALMGNHATRPEIIAAGKGEAKAVIHRSYTTGDTMLYFAQRVEPGTSPVAYVRVASSLEHIRAHLVNIRRSIWGSAIGIAFISMFLGFFMARSTGSAMRQLASRADRLATGQDAASSNPRYYGEFRELNQALSSIRDQLATRNIEKCARDEQLQAVLDGLTEGVIALNGEYRLLFANQQAALYLQFVKPASVGDNVTELAGNATIAKSLLEMMNPGHLGRRQILRDEQGRENLTLEMIPLKATPAGGAVFILTRPVGLAKYMAGVAQELRSPLAAIKACAETLIRHAKDDVANRDFFLQQLDIKADQLHRLIVDRLMLLQIESGERRFHFETVPLQPLIVACANSHQALANDGRLVLELAPSPVTEVWGDEQAVTEILDRVIENGLNSTPPSGVVRVECRTTSDQVIVAVRDAGVGISEMELSRIFDPFFKPSGGSAQNVGAGGGFAIVKGLAKAMGGDVAVESSLRRGTNVVVRLPRANHAGQR